MCRPPHSARCALSDDMQRGSTSNPDSAGGGCEHFTGGSVSHNYEPAVRCSDSCEQRVTRGGPSARWRCRGPSHDAKKSSRASFTLLISEFSQKHLCSKTTETVSGPIKYVLAARQAMKYYLLQYRGRIQIHSRTLLSWQSCLTVSTSTLWLSKEWRNLTTLSEKKLLWIFF